MPRDNEKKTDRQIVMEVGLTPEEAECWELAAALAGRFFKLPQLHLMDGQEVAHAVHVVQNKLMSRPAYRKYLVLARANAETPGE